MKDEANRADESLLADFVGGDNRAFEELMRRHEQRIFALAFRMTRDRADALDVTQEAFTAAFRQARSFRGDSAFSTWLFRVSINACNDFLRKRRRHAQPEEETVERAPGDTRMEDRAVARIDVVRALAALPAEYREAVAMHDLGGIPYEEIARLTETRIGTVKSRISRGRRRLAELMEHPVAPVTSKDPR